MIPPSEAVMIPSIRPWGKGVKLLLNSVGRGGGLGVSLLCSGATWCCEESTQGFSVNQAWVRLISALPLCLINFKHVI